LALASLQDLQAAGERAVTLRAAVAAAGDLRADLQANSAVALAILAETTAIAALLTLMLQVQCPPHVAHP
jgi:hypothetical protein